MICYIILKMLPWLMMAQTFNLYLNALCKLNDKEIVKVIVSIAIALEHLRSTDELTKQKMKTM